jgi:hypothetical protein
LLLLFDFEYSGDDSPRRVLPVLQLSEPIRSTRQRLGLVPPELERNHGGGLVRYNSVSDQKKEKKGGSPRKRQANGMNLQNPNNRLLKYCVQSNNLANHVSLYSAFYS